MDESKRLRALLDERGIEHKDNDTPINGVKNYMTTWHCTNGKLVSFIETEIPHATKLRIYNPTPEQAIAATVTTEPDEATMLKLHDRMNAALLDYESAMGIEGGNGANTVPFVIEMHQIIEDAATVGVGTCEGSFHESSDLSSGRVTLYYCKGTNKSIFMEREARFCPLCGKRIEEEAE